MKSWLKRILIKFWLIQKEPSFADVTDNWRKQATIDYIRASRFAKFTHPKEPPQD